MKQPIKVIVNTVENNRQLLGSDNSMFIRDLKTLNGIRNRIFKSMLFKKLQSNQRLIVSDIDNPNNILMTFKTFQVETKII